MRQERLHFPFLHAVGEPHAKVREIQLNVRDVLGRERSKSVSNPVWICALVAMGWLRGFTQRDRARAPSEERCGEELRFSPIERDERREMDQESEEAMD